MERAEREGKQAAEHGRVCWLTGLRGQPGKRHSHKFPRGHQSCPYRTPCGDERLQSGALEGGCEPAEVCFLS